MRFELRINGNKTYAVYDHLFDRSDMYDNFDDACRATEERNNQHLAEIDALWRQSM